MGKLIKMPPNGDIEQRIQERAMEFFREAWRAQNRRDHKKAVQLYERSLSVFPFPGAMLNLGYIYSADTEIKNLPLATEYFRQVTDCQ